jgi:hypothetical protein
MTNLMKEYLFSLSNIIIDYLGLYRPNCNYWVHLSKEVNRIRLNDRITNED